MVFIMILIWTNSSETSASCAAGVKSFLYTTMVHFNFHRKTKADTKMQEDSKKTKKTS